MPRPTSPAWNDRRVVSRITEGLSRQDHTVLALRYGEQLSVGETAAVLRIEPSEVESAVRRAATLIGRTLRNH